MPDGTTGSGHGLGRRLAHWAMFGALRGVAAVIEKAGHGDLAHEVRATALAIKGVARAR